MAKVLLVDPTGELVEKAKVMAPRLDSLRGKKIGLISDGVGNSNEFLLKTGELLKERYGIGEFIYKLKPVLSQRAPRDMMQDLLQKSDLVIVGVGL